MKSRLKIQKSQRLQFLNVKCVNGEAKNNIAKVMVASRHEQDEPENQILENQFLENQILDNHMQAKNHIEGSLTSMVAKIVGQRISEKLKSSLILIHHLPF